MIYTVFRPCSGSFEGVSTPAVAVAHVSKTFLRSRQIVHALQDVSLEITPGEFFGLLGPNGAGKSTTLEIIETLREKTSGTVMVNGFDLDKSPESIKKMIGVQLQTAGFYPNLNLTELIHLFVGLYQNVPIPPIR